MDKYGVSAVIALVIAIIGGAVWVGELSGKVDEIGKTRMPELEKAISAAEQQALQNIEQASNQIKGILRANRPPSEIIEPGGALGFGSWGEWAQCSNGEYVCGIQQKVEPYQGGNSDDTAVNGVRIRCCPLWPDGR